MTGNWGTRTAALLAAGGILVLWMSFFGGKAVLSDLSPVPGEPVSTDVIAPVGFELPHRKSTLDSLRQAVRESVPSFVMEDPESRRVSCDNIRRALEGSGADPTFIAGILRNDYYGTGILDEDLLRSGSTSDSVFRVSEETGRTPGTYQSFSMLQEARGLLKRDLMAVLSPAEAESISSLLLPDLLPAEAHRDSAIDVAVGMVSTVERRFQPGDTLLPAGGIPDREFFRIYDAMNSSISFPGPLRAVARLVPAALLILFAVAYGALAMGKVLTSPAKVMLLGCIWMLSLLCTWLLWQAGSARLQIISFSVFGACLTAVFFDSGGCHAWFFSLVFSALAGLGSGSPFTAFLVSALPAAFASEVFRRLGEKDISLSLLISVVGSVAVYWALHVAWIGPGYDLDTPVILFLTLVPLGSVATARILIHPVEVLFGVTTRLTYARLLNDEHPLRVRLREEARGTYTHSLQVAELAAAAAARLGVDQELARMGGFYHDIGKLKQPGMFVENMTDQSYYNPHDYMNPWESAALVIDHVQQGTRLARKYHLPPEVIDIIREHHGTGRTMSFLVKARNGAAPGETIDEAAFRYPGPKPRSIEAALVMIADSASSAVRMLKDKNEIALTVKRTIREKDDDGQFDQCGLTRSMQDDVWHIFLDILLKTEYERVKDYPHGS